MSFVHLHVHTDFSLLDGAASIKSLVARAKELGMPALAITDHGNMFGVIRFYKECKANGIKPIIGCEYYVAGGKRTERTGTEGGNKYYHLILLAKNDVGYHNLVMLSSRSYTEGFYYKPRIDRELLEQYHEGLICLSACIAGEIPQYILMDKKEEALSSALWYRDLFGAENYFLELQDHKMAEEHKSNKGLIEIAKEIGVGLVVTNDIHYLNKEDDEAHDVLLCIGTNHKVTDEKRMRFPSAEFYFKTEEEMAALVPDTPEAISNTIKICDMCNLIIPQPGPLLPAFQIPDTFTEENNKEAEPLVQRIADYLAKMSDEAICKPNPKNGKVPVAELASEMRTLLKQRLEMPITRYFIWRSYNGLEMRYNTPNQIQLDRIQYELSTIILMDFVGYFLIVADFINWSKDHNIPVGPGRGSGAGSIVAYALRITNIEPLYFKLLFERFLNPERVSMPDFDVDFCFEGRGNVIDYVTEKYGIDRVGQIITFGKMKAKQVIKDCARALNIPLDESNKIVKLIPDDTKMTLKKAMDENPDLVEISKLPQYAKLFSVAFKLEDKNRHTSLHACGIVIGKTVLTDYVPLFKDPKTGTVASQYTMDLIEDCGLVKMDFLGLKTLTIIKHTLEMMKKDGIEMTSDDIPLDDKATYEMLSEGKSASVFQFESVGMQNILKQAQPSRIEDIIALNALYRPGPMDNIPQFIECKHGREAIKYFVPSLDKYLKETYGVIVYQEQVMQVAQEVAGFSLGRADLLRRAMGKKKPEVLEKEKIPFIEGAVNKGYTKEKALEIFEALEPFAGYGFNKSHAAAYSVVAFQTAYLKCHYPAEYMAANLTNEINSPDKLTQYIAEVRKLGIKIVPPNINFSESNFSVTNGQIVYGLIGVKGIGQGVVEDIVKERTKNGLYKDFMDFLSRVGVKSLNKKSIETLINAGCFDSFVENRNDLILNLENAYVYVEKKLEREDQVSLFDENDPLAYPPFVFSSAPQIPRNEMLKIEKNLLGFYFSGHPLDDYKNEYYKCCDVDFVHPERSIPGKKYTLIGQLVDYKVVFTKTNRKYARGVVEGYDGSIDIVVFGDAYEDNATRFIKEEIIFLSGTIDTSRDTPSFKVEGIVTPSSLKAKMYSNLHIILEKINNKSELMDLRELLCDSKGRCNVIFHVQENNETLVRAHSSITCPYDEDFLEKVKMVPIVKDVWLN